jgi:hypothetical protein
MKDELHEPRADEDDAAGHRDTGRRSSAADQLIRPRDQQASERRDRHGRDALS